MIDLIRLGIFIIVLAALMAGLKRRMDNETVKILKEENGELRNALDGLYHQHAGWPSGMGPCVCESHKKAYVLLNSGGQK